MTGFDKTSRPMRSAISRARFVERSVERDLEILSLSNVPDPVVAEKLDRVLDGFALWVENTRFKCDVNFCFHSLSQIIL